MSKPELTIADPGPAPAKTLYRKKATLTVDMDADVNQNDFKAWLKTCPVEISAQGDQTVTWENYEKPNPAFETWKGQKLAFDQEQQAIADAAKAAEAEAKTDAKKE